MFGQIVNKLKSLWYLRIKRMNRIDYNIMLMRRSGVKIGEGCRIFTFISSREPSLISIGDRTTVSTNVQFCTHDNAICKAIQGKTDIMGRITVGSDCFLGLDSILLYGVTLGDHCIVGAGSVVTKSFPAGSVIAGNPAKRVCGIEDYAEKYRAQAYNYNTVPISERQEFFEKHPELLVER